MTPADDFTRDNAELLEGRYDCMDRITLNGFYPMGCTSGGLLTWWNRLHPGVTLEGKRLQAFAGAIECKWNASSFDPQGLAAFRDNYPRGRNFVVSPRVTDTYDRKTGCLEITHLPVAQMRTEFAVSRTADH